MVLKGSTVGHDCASKHSISIGQSPQKECHAVLSGISTRDDGFYSGYTHNESTNVTSTDCHAGNPCDYQRDPTAKIYKPMIERMYGRD
ncbi:hypothetical protein Tco_0283017 [Tanacetum coccineum]